MIKLYSFIVLLLCCFVSRTYASEYSIGLVGGTTLANEYSIDLVDGKTLKECGYRKIEDESFINTKCTGIYGTRASDDGYYVYTPSKSFSFKYLGKTYSGSIFMNVNGAISFDSPLCGYTTEPLSGLGKDVIAGYWCDIDLLTKYKDENAEDKSGGMFIKEVIVNDKIEAVKFLWYRVGKYRSNSSLNNDYVTFQITLVNQDNSEGSDNVYFCYKQIDFINGTASPSSSAIVGLVSDNGLIEIGSYSSVEDARVIQNECIPYDVSENPIEFTPSSNCVDGKYTIEVFNRTGAEYYLVYDNKEEVKYTSKGSRSVFQFPADGSGHTVAVYLLDDKEDVSKDISNKTLTELSANQVVNIEEKQKSRKVVFKKQITAPSCLCSSDDWDININGEDLAASYCSNKLLTFSTKSKKDEALTNPKYTWSFSNSESSDFSTPEKTYTVSGKKTVSVQITSDECKNGINLTRDFAIDLCPVEQVCPTEFAPTAGKKYILSGWMHADNATNATSYEGFGSILVKYIGLDQFDECIPSGDIIDGWQRIYKEITIPTKATELYFEFVSKDKDCYFDDVRFHPVDASMVSYVYDPVTLRLVAELDNENYATFYEYDEEGAMIRVKKETERGIMTIKEARQGGVKAKK